jgi:uncharacterized protein YqcC (DUF446 family)
VLHDRVTLLLRLLEEELRTQNRWDPAPPDAEALRSTVPFAADVLSFDQWLQWILLPRIQALLDLGAALPTRCAIQPMAEEIYADDDLPAQRIIGLLRELDRVLSDQNDE